MSVNKIFILDTNVILHDYRAIYSFMDNDIVIPVTVLEELDNFKKGNNLINFQAREFMRVLDKLVGDVITQEGISLGENKGTLYIEPTPEFSREMENLFNPEKHDHQIIAIADYLHRKHSYDEVILVSKDINVRMKTKAMGMKSQDYQTGKVEVSHFMEGARTFTEQPEEAVAGLYKDADNEGIPLDQFDVNEELTDNQYIILKSSEKSNALACYHAEENLLKQVPKLTAYGITPRNAEQAFAVHALVNSAIQLVSFTGKAGTGKTLLALASALRQHENYKQIFLARPIVPLANREMGYLPGNAQDKINPYMQPLFDNLDVIKHRFPENSIGFEQINQLQESNKLLIEPLAFIRGRTLDKVFFIVDEAQNLTPHEVKTIITRAGEGTKLVFTGDLQQIDSPFLDSQSNGLAYLTDKMKGESVFAHVHLIKGERSYLSELASNLL